MVFRAARADAIDRSVSVLERMYNRLKYWRFLSLLPRRVTEGRAGDKTMTKKAFDQIMEGLNEALAVVCGEATPARISEGRAQAFVSAASIEDAINPVSDACEVRAVGAAEPLGDRRLGKMDRRIRPQPGGDHGE